jgi:hypothetical protein
MLSREMCSLRYATTFITHIYIITYEPPMEIKEGVDEYESVRIAPRKGRESPWHFAETIG